MPTKTFFNLPVAKRNHIEAAAIDEFSTNPFACASITAIVAHTGIAKGSFYQYFADKKDLYGHLLSLARQRKLELAASITPASNNLDIFAYLRWMLQIEVLFELRQPKLAKIEQRAFLERDPGSPKDPESALTVEDLSYFNDFLAQGILHDDVATWVDTELGAFLLGGVYHQVGQHLISRLGDQAKAIADGSVDIREDPLAQDLLDNLMDLLEAGMARDPQIRMDFFSK
ncbi:MAG: TetR/AcrR family transcriptional regulator [Anaerolineaceae bacterium]